LWQAHEHVTCRRCRQTDRQTDSERQKDRHGQTHIDRHRQTQTDIDWQQNERDTQKQTEKKDAQTHRPGRTESVREVWATGALAGESLARDQSLPRKASPESSTSISRLAGHRGPDDSAVG
jgi:hypothetical protein